MPIATQEYHHTEGFSQNAPINNNLLKDFVYSNLISNLSEMKVLKFCIQKLFYFNSAS